MTRLRLVTAPREKSRGPYECADEPVASLEGRGRRSKQWLKNKWFRSCDDAAEDFHMHPTGIDHGTRARSFGPSGTNDEAQSSAKSFNESLAAARLPQPPSGPRSERSKTRPHSRARQVSSPSSSFSFGPRSSDGGSMLTFSLDGGAKLAHFEAGSSTDAFDGPASPRTSCAGQFGIGHRAIGLHSTDVARQGATGGAAADLLDPFSKICAIGGADADDLASDHSSGASPSSAFLRLPKRVQRGLDLARTADRAETEADPVFTNLLPDEGTEERRCFGRGPMTCRLSDIDLDF